MANAYLPEHILHQIFIRMPTKPLVRLKCLSKRWKRMISDPKFMKSRSRRMIFVPSMPFHAIDNTATDNPMMIKLLSPSVNPKTRREMTVVGSFNGIVLLVLKYWDTIGDDLNLYDNDMFLFNPFIGKFKKVPDCSGSLDSSSNYVYGFGYGTAAHDLEIVRLKGHLLSGNDSETYEIFDLKTQSWSRPSELIGDYSIYKSYSGTFANGFLYWNAMRVMDSRPRFILALDIKNMIFSEMENPNEHCFMRMGTYNERLCMLCTEGEGYDLWVMNEHGFGKSWSKIRSFTLSRSLPSPFTMQISYPSNYVYFG